MKKLLIILFFSPFISFSQVRVINDTTINGNWNLQGKLLSLSAKISGNVTISNAIIEANPYIQIFDTSVNLSNCRTKEFSTAWYGAKQSNVDNFWQLQKSINTCIANNIVNLYVAESYRYSQSLKVCNLYNQQYTACNLNIYGDGNMQQPVQTLTFTGKGMGIGFQMMKGGSVKGLWFVGNYLPPEQTDICFFTTIWPSAFHPGIVIDYDGTRNVGGSSAFKVLDCMVSNYDVAYDVSPNGVTFNADMLYFDYIGINDCRIGIRSGQAQEKGNVINYVKSWGKLNTLIQIGNSGKYQAGQYTINNGNIAGWCVQLFDVQLSGWNSFHVKGLYGEGVGRIGNIYSATSQHTIPAEITVDIRLVPKATSNISSIINANNNRITFRNCTIWYYGYTDQTLVFTGKMCFDSPDFGASRVTANDALFIDKLWNGLYLPAGKTFIQKPYYLN